jgi:hypothetical protein
MGRSHNQEAVSLSIRDSSVSIVTRLRVARQRKAEGDLSLLETFRRALRSIQPRIQWIAGVPSLDKATQRMKLSTLFHLEPRLRMRGAYLRSTILHGVGLN